MGYLSVGVGGKHQKSTLEGVCKRNKMSDICAAFPESTAGDTAGGTQGQVRGREQQHQDGLGACSPWPGLGCESEFGGLVWVRAHPQPGDGWPRWRTLVGMEWWQSEHCYQSSGRTLRLRYLLPPPFPTCDSIPSMFGGCSIQNLSPQLCIQLTLNIIFLIQSPILLSSFYFHKAWKT